MTTAIATTTGADLAPVFELTEDKVALLQRTLCPDLTPDEMELFAGICRRARLDPFSKQIYALKRKQKNNRGGWDEKLSIQTGIDGFRVIAARTGEIDGQEGPYWCGPEGIWVDVWLSSIPPEAAKVVVYRKGCARPWVGIAKFWEYAQTYNGAPSGMWARMPANQIAKCAEALALRKAFPADLSGLYVTEEMEQAGALAEIEASAPPAVAATQPQPAPVAAPAEAAKKQIEGAKPAKGNPETDVAAILTLAWDKGADYPAVVRWINERFGGRHSYTIAWDKIPADRRAAAAAAFRAMPDHDSAAELTGLLSHLAERCKVEPSAVFQRYAVSAGLPENVIGVDDLRLDQIKAACAAFRSKIDELNRAKESKANERTAKK